MAGNLLVHTPNKLWRLRSDLTRSGGLAQPHKFAPVTWPARESSRGSARSTQVVEKRIPRHRAAHAERGLALEGELLHFDDRLGDVGVL